LFDPWALLELVADAIHEVQQVANNPAYLYSTIAGSLYRCRSHTSIAKQRGQSEAATRLITIKLLGNYFNRPNFFLTITKHGPSILVGLLVDPGSWISIIMSYAQGKKLFYPCVDQGSYERKRR
jgi:hypothetical protein